MDKSNTVPQSQNGTSAIILKIGTCVLPDCEEIDRWYTWVQYPERDEEGFFIVKCKLFIACADGTVMTEVVGDSHCL